MLLRPVRVKTRSAVAVRWAWVALLPGALTGCPLTDNYFVDPNAGAAGLAPSPAAGSGGTAGGGALGGDGNGGSGGDGRGGTSVATGGSDIGGNAAVGGTTAGSGETGGVSGANAGGTGGAGAAAEAGMDGMGGDATCVAEVCDGVSNDCDEEIDEGSVCPTGCTAREYGGHTYVLCLSLTAMGGSNYDAAYARCGGLAAELGLDGTFDLASIEDAEEDAFLKAWIAERSTVADGAVWMGGNDLELENTWVWGRGASAVQFFQGKAAGGGTPFMGRYNDFGPGKPNSSNTTDEDCGVFDAEVDWQWNDRECTKKQMGFVCERQP